MSTQNRTWTNHNQRIESVRIYTDLDAFKARDFSLGWALKARHDDLYQTALDRFPVTHVALIQDYQMSADGLPHTVAQDHPLWWPANRTDKNLDRLILVPLDQFARNWLTFRTAAEKEFRCTPRQPLWVQDPALFEKQEGTDYYLCRACCVGHEGYVHYFVYPYEDEWEQALTRHGFDFFGTGEGAYRTLLLEPGKVGGR